MNPKWNQLKLKDKIRVRKLLQELKSADAFESVKITEKILKIVKKCK